MSWFASRVGFLQRRNKQLRRVHRRNLLGKGCFVTPFFTRTSFAAITESSEAISRRPPHPQSSKSVRRNTRLPCFIWSFLLRCILGDARRWLWPVLPASENNRLLTWCRFFEQRHQERRLLCSPKSFLFHNFRTYTARMLCGLILAVL